MTCRRAGTRTSRSALVRAGGVLTMLTLGTFIGVMLRRDFRGRKEDYG